MGDELDRALEFHRAGRFDEAIELYQSALLSDPLDADALYLFGCLKLQRGEAAEARGLLERAVAVAPEQGEYRHALGLALRTLGEESFDSGCRANECGNYVEARECFARVVEMCPHWMEARHNLGRADYELGLVSEAFEEFGRCESEQSLAMMAVIAPGVPQLGQSRILEVRRAWGDGVPVEPLARATHGGLRVGFVSSFFHRENWMKPVWGVMERMEKMDLEVHVFSDCAQTEVRKDLKVNYGDSSRLSNGELAVLVQRSGIDVLVDLNGYSNMRRLPMFRRRVAPVVMGWFNYYATSGMSGIDFLIGDSEVVLPEEEQWYSEKVLRVRGSYLAFEVSYPVPEVEARRAGPFVFGAFASAYKITDQVLEAWCSILRQCQGSLLLVKNRQLGYAAGREFFAARFARFGIGTERLLLEGPEPHYEFLKAYGRVDLALDTFPYNGGTTTTEAIWQGVPVVTFVGDRWASRTSASILRAGGLGEFVGEDLKGYVRLAVRLGLGGVGDLRGGMRKRLRGSMVCDVDGLAEEMVGLLGGVLR